GQCVEDAVSLDGDAGQGNGTALRLYAGPAELLELLEPDRQAAARLAHHLINDVATIEGSGGSQRQETEGGDEHGPTHRFARVVDARRRTGPGEQGRHAGDTGDEGELRRRVGPAADVAERLKIALREKLQVG